MEFLQSLWNWYWSGAHIPVTSENPSGADAITMLFLLWNLVMEPIWVRIGVVALGFWIVIERVSSSKNKQKIEMEKKSISNSGDKSNVSANRNLNQESIKPVGESLENTEASGSVDQAEVRPEQGLRENQEAESTIESTGVDETFIAVSGAPERANEPLTIQEVREALTRANKTQTDLADALNVTRFYVSKILSGSKPFTPELQSKCQQVLSDWGIER